MPVQKVTSAVPRKVILEVPKNVTPKELREICAKARRKVDRLYSGIKKYAHQHRF